jgi:hypothetical protein
MDCPDLALNEDSDGCRQGWRTRLLGARPCCFAWEGRRRSEGGHLAFLARENVATLAVFTNEERSESRD